MNKRAYGIGVVYVLLTMAAAVVVRSYAEAAFLNHYGVKYLPHFLIASALAFGAAATAYDLMSRRISQQVLDGTLIVLEAAACVVAPVAFARGGGALFAAALALIGLSSVANLAAWNGVAATVMGRTARRSPPRAGAAVTLGGVIAGFGSRWLIGSVGVELLPRVALGVTAGMLACAILLGRALRSGIPAPAPAPGPGPAAAAAPAPSPSPSPSPPASPASGLAGDARRMVFFLACAALAEAIVSGFIEFHFTSTLKARYPKGEVARVIATFYGATSAGLLVLQILAVPRILVTRSMPFTASVHPAALLGGVGALLTWPGFALLAGVRTADGVLRAATSRTTQELSLGLLGPADRPRWKLLLRGVVTPLGGALAGTALIALPALRMTPRALLGVELGVALLWLFAVRTAARAFVATLAAPLGMKQVALADSVQRVPLRLDQLLALIERTGDDDATAAAVARALVTRSGARADELGEHLTHEDPRVRAGLLTLAARHPHPAATPELRALLAVEGDDAALIALLRALAVHADSSAELRARELGRSGGPVALAASAYLAGIGKLDAARTAEAARQLLDSDGTWSADIVRAARKRGQTLDLDGELVRRMALPATRRQACLCGLGCGGSAFAARWRELLAAGDRDAAAAVERGTGWDAPTLLEQLAGATPSARANLARALRTSPAPGAPVVLAALLSDDDTAVRELAARALARELRDRGAAAPAAEVDAAVTRELDNFAIYLAARAPAGSRPALHEAELERQTRLCLSAALALIALEGNARALYAAERRLASPQEMLRRRALDLLQEVSRGRPRLLELVERFLGRPGSAPGAAAEAAVLAIDPWLARVFGGKLGDLERRVAALRQSSLYHDVPGAELGALAERASEWRLRATEVVVHEGERGDTMYHVLEGALTVQRGGADVGTLGPGQSFGELALVSDSPRQATIRAAEPSLLLAVPRAAFQELLASSPDMGLGLLRSLTRWLRG